MRGWVVAAAAATVMAACGDNGNAPVDAIPGTDVGCSVSLTAIPGQLDLGTVGVGDTRSGTVAIANTGTCATRGLAYLITGTAANSYAVTSSACAGAVLPPGAACTLVVGVVPASAGSTRAELVVESADAPLSVSLVTTAVAVDHLTLTGSPYTFPLTAVSATSATHRFEATNISGFTMPAPFVVTAGGSNPTEFAIVADTCTGAKLLAGQSCHVDVAFKPTSPGAKSASIAIAAPIFGQLSAAVTGTAIPAGTAFSTSPAMIDFGFTSDGVRQTVTVSYTGSVPSGTITTALGGANPESYQLANDTCSGAVLTAPTTCTFDIVTTCTNPGIVRNATVTVSGLPGSTQTVPITGTVAGKACAAIVQWNPTVQNFSDQWVMTTGTATRFTATNFGGEPTAPLAPTITGPDANDFTIIADTCTGVVLDGASSCTVDVAFSPQSAGFKQGSLHVTEGSANLTGRGVLPTVPLAISPAMNDFGALAFATKTFTVKNTGSTTTGAVAIAITGTDAHRFEPRNDMCSGAMLIPGGTCTFDVRTTCAAPFTPLTATASADVSASPGGVVSASLTSFVSGKSCSSVTSVNPSSAQYGNQTVSTTSTAQTFSFSNYGGQPSGTVTATLGGANANDFVISNDTCTGTVLPVGGAPCTVDVAFAPHATGAKQATLYLTGTPSGMAALSGTGVP